MIIDFLLIIIGFVLLIKGADFLVDGASEIAKKFKIPEIVIGLTIVAIGTSMPELVVSLTSALEGHSDLAIGNIVGSNIANMFLILGVCSIIKPLIFKKETRIFEIPFTIFASILLFIFCINSKNGQSNIITSKEGIILLIFCAMFVFYNLIMAKKGEKFNKNDSIIEIRINHQEQISIVGSFLWIIFGIIGLKLGGDIVVNNASEIAINLGITEKLISLTVVAFSTSLPELITSISATRKGETDMAIGNILGSQIFNILLIIGLSSAVAPIQYSIEYNYNLLLLIFGSILLGLFPFVGKKNQMSRVNGGLFVVVYCVYLCVNVFLT